MLVGWNVDESPLRDCKGMSQFAIKVEDLWKQYAIGRAQQRAETFYDLLAQGLNAPLRAIRRSVSGSAEAKTEKFWALQGINLEVAPGEVMGVIGRNGAGKSTLLKVLSRITAPTKGRVTIRGRLASLLEVGTGFHPELTGRENIFLNGAILGMSRREVTRKFDEIVAFAEVEQFIDTPVKRYSSGMYVRLAFSVAAHLDVDVLVIDEVLAVGDAEFQERCLSKMDGVSKSGRTVIFVSHNLAAVSRMCNRVALLSKGRLAFLGPVEEGVVEYTREADGALHAGHFMGNLTPKLTFSEICINGSPTLAGNVIMPDEKIRVTVSGEAHQPLKGLTVALALRCRDQHVLTVHDVSAPMDIEAGKFSCDFSIAEFRLSPHLYMVGIGAFTVKGPEWLWNESAACFSIANIPYPGYDPKNMGLVNLGAHDCSGSRTRAA